MWEKRSAPIQKPGRLKMVFENFLFRLKDIVSTRIQFAPARLALIGIISGLVVFTSSCIGKRASDIHAYRDAMPASEKLQDTTSVKHPGKQK